MWESLEQALQFNTTGTPNHFIPFGVLMARLGVAFGMGCVAAAIHWFTAGGYGRRRADPLLDGPGYEPPSEPTLAATFVLLSVLIALVMIVINDSAARAFSLAGALAIVRFRTVVDDTRDTAFVMFAVISGMAAGTGYLIGPVACTPVVLLAAWLFRVRPPRVAPPRVGTLVLRMGAGRSPDEPVHAALKQYLAGPYRLIGLSTARGGSALDATYAVPLPPPDRVFALVGELTRIDGVQGVELKED